MNVNEMVAQMSLQAGRIRALAEGVPDEQARWKPAAEAWSILEVINHLLDEEREDFRVRLDIILHRPAESWALIDPREWVVARAYNRRDLAQSLNNFLTERQRSLDWLRGLGEPDWAATVMAPWEEPIAAGDMAAAWVAHDLLHTRQLVELHWAWTQAAVLPYRTYYAGDW